VCQSHLSIATPGDNSLLDLRLTDHLLALPALFATPSARLLAVDIKAQPLHMIDVG
jgi:hypothetical protein